MTSTLSSMAGRKAEAAGARAFFRACLTVFWTASTMCSAMRLPTWSTMRLVAPFFFRHVLWYVACFSLRISCETVSMRLPVISVWVCTSGILQPTFRTAKDDQRLGRKMDWAPGVRVNRNGHRRQCSLMLVLVLVRLLHRVLAIADRNLVGCPLRALRSLIAAFNYHSCRWHQQ